MRPAALAEDATPTTPVVRHALDTLAALNGYAPERVLLLQPTSPLRTAADVDAAVALFDERDANAVVSVGPAADHPDLLRRVSDHGVLEEYSPHSSATRRQELEQIYALNGAIYLARRDSLLARDSFYAERTYAYVMPPERSIDVDDPWDLHLCDLILRDRLARD